MNLLTIIGARPQFIKAATVSRIIRERTDISEILVHTGQHYDANMSEIFFRELDIPEPHYNLEVGSGRHGEQTALMLSRLEQVLLKEKPDCVLIYGDTNSTVAGALAASKLHIPVAHVEAGLRSFNRHMPEEINRIASDHISDRLYAPTETAMKHLKREGLVEKAVNSGDVMYDSVLFYKRKVENGERKKLKGKRIKDQGKREKGEGKRIIDKESVPEHYHLVTIHRPDNTDNLQNLKAIFSAFGKIDHPFVIPLHPRTRKFIADTVDIPSNVTLLEPVGYLQMLALVMDADKVFTDSGGLQKETYFLRKPCITLRNETEWVETVHNNWNTLTGANEEKIIRAAKLPLPDSEINQAFGDGNAAGKIINDLLGNK